MNEQVVAQSTLILVPTMPTFLLQALCCVVLLRVAYSSYRSSVSCVLMERYRAVLGA